MAVKVSICIPAYGQPDQIRRTLDSIIEQDYSDFEIVITDDSCDDSVKDIVKSYLPSHQVKYFKNSKRLGSPENWNCALQHAKGDYIKFMHHDDWFSRKDSLFSFVQMLDNNPDVDLAFSSCANYTPEQTLRNIRNPSEKQRKKLNKDPNFLLPFNIIGPPSATIFRNNPNIKFDSKLKWVVDIDFYIRILKLNKSFIYNPTQLVFITTGSDMQVTAECENNQDVELFEWIYLYNKIDKKWLPRWLHVNFFWRLLNKYKIKSKDEIIQAGVQEKVPLLITALLAIRWLFRR